MARLLCIDDDPEMTRNVGEYLSAWEENPYGRFDVEVENSFESAIDRLKYERFDLITLDLHAKEDIEPAGDEEDQRGQEGRRVLAALQKARFVPVIFYTGYADKIAGLETAVVKVVKKGQDDLDELRKAAAEIYATGLPGLLDHIEEETRAFAWDTVDRMWSQLGPGVLPEDLAYLLARRLASRFNRESVKELLKHKLDAAKPIEMYIYPAANETIKTGCVLVKDEKEIYWIVATPACDFVQGNAEKVLLIGATELRSGDRYTSWAAGSKWKGGPDPKDPKEKTIYNNLRALIGNRAGDRYRFLPGTFFLPDLVVDLQMLNQISLGQLNERAIVCRLDSPFREDFFLNLSRYYGRMGTPDLDISAVVNSL